MSAGLKSHMCACAPTHSMSGRERHRASVCVLGCVCVCVRACVHGFVHVCTSTHTHETQTLEGRRRCSPPPLPPSLSSSPPPCDFRENAPSSHHRRLQSFCPWWRSLRWCGLAGVQRALHWPVLVCGQVALDIGLEPIHLLRCQATGSSMCVFVR